MGQGHVGLHCKFLGAPPEQVSRHWARLDLVHLLLDDVTRVRPAACASLAAPRAPDLSYRTAPRRPLLRHLFPGGPSRTRPTNYGYVRFCLRGACNNLVTVKSRHSPSNSGGGGSPRHRARACVSRCRVTSSARRPGAGGASSLAGRVAWVGGTPPAGRAAASARCRSVPVDGSRPRASNRKPSREGFRPKGESLFFLPAESNVFLDWMRASFLPEIYLSIYLYHAGYR